MATVLDRKVSSNGSGVPARDSSSRMSSRSRARLAIGVLVVVCGVLLNLAIYRSLDHKTPVLQLARDVPAGEQLRSDDFSSVEIAANDSFRSVPANELSSLVGSYAKVRLIAGALLAREAVQAEPLVAPGSAVIAVTIAPGEVPVGLRERSRVQLVLLANDDDSALSVEGRVVGLPASSSTTGQVSVSVELAEADASSVASAKSVRLVLLDPGTDG